MSMVAYDDLWCIAVIIIWILAGLFIGMVLGAGCIGLWVLAQIYLHDSSVDAWALLFIEIIASIITLIIIEKWLPCPGGSK